MNETDQVWLVAGAILMGWLLWSTWITVALWDLQERLQKLERQQPPHWAKQE